MSQLFYVGDEVEWTSTTKKRSGQTFRGVVIKVGKKSRGRRRYSVETSAGAFRVPESMLTRVKLDKDQAERLAKEGKEKAKERQEAKEALKEKRAANKLDRYADRLEKLAPLVSVEVYSRRAWQPATVVRVDRERAKVTTTNPARDLVEAFGPFPGNRQPSKTITVGLDKVRLPDEPKLGFF